MEGSAEMKKAEVAARRIAEIDKEIAELIRRVKITGTLDQSRNLILGEKESIDEAVERNKKMNKLREEKKYLNLLLQESNSNFGATKKPR